MSNINGVNAFDLLCEDLIFIKVAFNEQSNAKQYEYKIHKSQIGIDITSDMLTDESEMRKLLIGRFAVVRVQSKAEWDEHNFGLKTVKIEDVVMRADKTFDKDYGTRFIVQLVDETQCEALNETQNTFVKEFNRERNKAVQAQIMTAMFGGEAQANELQQKLIAITGKERK